MIAVLLTVVMLAGKFPIHVAAENNTAETGIVDGQAYTTSMLLSLNDLMEKFPAGKYWNHIAQSGHSYSDYNDTGTCNNPDGWSESPCYTHSQNAPTGKYDCNSFNGGIQCCGFARKLAYDAYGSYATNWPYHVGTDAVNYMKTTLKPGDVMHYKGGTADATYGQWVFVIGVDGSSITV